MVEEIEEFTNLNGIREKHINALSKGMKNRVSVARALVHDPPVLIMDEPAAGLDPRARIELRELLKVLAGQGKAILISSHILTELAEICTGAVFIERGKILRAGTLEQLLAEDVAAPQRRHPSAGAAGRYTSTADTADRGGVRVWSSAVEVRGGRRRGGRAATCWPTWWRPGLPRPRVPSAPGRPRTDLHERDARRGP